MVAIYVQVDRAWWGSKPGADSVWPVSPTGAFRVPEWASPGTRDIVADAVAVVVLPAGGVGVPVLGAPTLPGILLARALCPPAVFARAAAPPVASVSASAEPVLPVAWPTAPGARRTPVGGTIAAFGYVWQVKDSGGARVGPGGRGGGRAPPSPPPPGAHSTR